MSILTNNSAMVALQTLKSINKDLNTVQDQISTGLKVGSAKDSAAIWGISQVMRSDVAGFEAISESLSLGSSTVSVARSATEEISDLLQEIKGKVVSANEDNFDRAKLQTEVDQLRGQITGIVDAAQFNGLNLLKSPEGIDILSSLDRASTGSVTSSQISVAGFDFSAEAGTAGTGAATLSTSVSGTGATAATASINIDNAAAYLGANTFGLQIGDFDLSFDAAALAASGAAGTTDDDFATFLAAEINALGIEGVTATASLGGTGNSRVDLVSTASSTLALAPGTLNTVAAFTAADVTDVAGGTAITEAAGSSATTNTAATATVTFAGTAPSVAAGESIDFSFGADTFTYTNNTGAGITTNAALVTDIAAFYAANASAQVAGIDLADGGGGVLTISNTDSTESKTISVDMSGATTASGDIVRSGPEVAAATEGAAVVGIGGGAVNEGDTFSVTIGTDQFDYIAGQNENINDVARGLQSVIASDGPSDVGVTLTLAGDVATGSAQLSITGPSGYAVSASDSRGGTATGDLYALSQIDVTTDEGAAKALNAVENLIQTVVDAASDFGSAGKRLEIQESFLSKLSDSLKSGIGALVDADMEEASARLQALQVQQQLGVQALSIANQAPQNVLSLFR